MEEIIMNIIMYAGNARACYLNAFKYANANDFEKAYEEMAVGKENVTQAHKIQTTLIQEEIRGNKNEISLLMIHAQDHLMTALAIRDLVELFVDKMKKVNEEIQELKNNLNA